MAAAISCNGPPSAVRAVINSTGRHQLYGRARAGPDQVRNDLRAAFGSGPNEVVADIVGRNYLVARHLVASDDGRQRDGIAKHSCSANHGTVL